MKLADDLAANRRLYRRGLSDLPDILVIDVPVRYASPSMPLGRFYPMMIETALEAVEVDHFLRVERTHMIVPDLLDRRPSQFQRENVMLCHYDTEDPAWPHILLCQWPCAYTALAGRTSELFARQAYTVELFTYALDRAKATQMLLASLSGSGMTPLLVSQGD